MARRNLISGTRVLGFGPPRLPGKRKPICKAMQTSTNVSKIDDFVNSSLLCNWFLAAAYERTGDGGISLPLVHPEAKPVVTAEPSVLGEGRVPGKMAALYTEGRIVRAGVGTGPAASPAGEAEA